jgi:hypothetical protein
MAMMACIDGAEVAIDGDTAGDLPDDLRRWAVAVMATDGPGAGAMRSTRHGPVFLVALGGRAILAKNCGPGPAEVAFPSLGQPSRRLAGGQILIARPRC